MCPDKSILSAYFDGEIDMPIQNIIEQHLNTCTACRNTVAGFAMVRRNMEASIPSSLERNKEYIRERVLRGTGEQRQTREFWHRKLLIPAPLALAAGALVFLLVGSMALVSVKKGGPPTLTQQVNPKSIEIRVDDLARLKDLLESPDMVVEVNMKLPEQKNFRILGEPQILTTKSVMHK